MDGMFYRGTVVGREDLGSRRAVQDFDSVVVFISYRNI